MESFKKRQMTMWELFWLPESIRRSRRKAHDASKIEQGRPPDGLEQKKDPEVAPGRKVRQRAS
ncbi:hypothetical protein UFOVP122_14 [uncultured Caudovirales phage]|uniref:Uncharacterized protein n=1 Tax=uncultured Caudovirales phage TaxID=2100421 RepID=A0A6J5LCG5_9CAUD|nr:hypothetical protein UFOVP122_14 [uncultured Caudovirales phage]